LAELVAENDLRAAAYSMLFVSSIILNLFGIKSTSTGSTVHYAFLWGHVLIILGFLVYIPFSKHLHIITSEFNVFFTRTKALGKLRPIKIDMAALESDDAEMLTLGAATVQ